MSYDDWKQVIQGQLAGLEHIAAQVANLDSETRCSEMKKFRADLGDHYAQGCASRLAPGEAAKASLEEAVKWTRPIDSAWLCLLPLPAAASIPAAEVYTHATAKDLRRYAPKPGFNPKNPPPAFTINRPFMTDANGQLAKRFIWVTFDPDGRPPTDDPTQIVQELGLPHIAPGELIYRIPLRLKKDTLFIPTCLDAGLYAAWAIPPAGHSHPWGLTRNISTGAPGKPELLSEARAHYDERPTAILVPQRKPPVPVGVYAVDYMINRT